MANRDSDLPRQPMRGGGCLIAAGAILGPVVGIALGETSLGLLVGLALGIAGAVIVAVLDRRR